MRGMSMGMGTLLYGGGAGAATPTYTAPYHENFTGTAAANLNGRAVSDLTWTEVSGHVAAQNAVKLTGTGEAYGTANAGNGAFTFSYLAPTLGDELWAQRRLSAFAATFTLTYFSWAEDVAYVGDGSTNVWNKVVLSIGNSGLQGPVVQTLVGLTANSSTGAVTRESALNVYIEPGDNLELRGRKVGATYPRDIYHNGRKHKVGTFDFNTILSRNGRVALGGGMTNVAGRQVSDMDIVDPALHAAIRVDRPARVAQLNALGGLTIPLEGDYSLAAPTALTATVLKGTDESVVTGYASKAMTALVIDAPNKRWSATLTIDAADVTSAAMKTTGFIVRVERNDITGGGMAVDHTCLQYAGETTGTLGQSLAQQLWFNAQSGLTVKGWIAEGSSDRAAATIDRRYRRSTTIRNASKILDVLSTLTGVADKSLCFMEGGVGGRYIDERAVGTSFWTDFTEGVRMAGKSLGVLHLINGHFEVTDPSTHYGGSGATWTSPQLASIIAMIQAQMDAVDALQTEPVKVVVWPLGAIQTANNARAEAIRRLHWQLTQDYPSRYVRGPMTAHMQHATADVYHLSTPSYLVQATMLAYSTAKERGYISEDRVGPDIYSLTRNSATQLVVRFALNGASTMALANYAYASDGRGGLTFATDSAFASAVSPNAAPTVGTPSGGYVDVTFDFAANSFPGTAYLRGPYGSNPFNRANDATINSAMATNASIWQAVYADASVAAIQPYYHSSGNDYLSAS